MTEAEWLAAASASELYAALPKGTSERKLRLFVCACWRAYHRDRTEGRRKLVRDKKHLADLLAAVEAGEARADGGTAKPPGAVGSWYATMSKVKSAARDTAGDSFLTRRRIPVGVLRDIFGNPFRPVALDPVWLTSDVLALARGIYDDRAFDRMPILADALQDAGCDSNDLLNHCRDVNQVHVRGCWVVDLVLGLS